MNIIEAAKTGKRIRPIDGDGFWYAPGGIIPYALIHRDWEIEDPPITLTRAKFEAAFQRAVGDPWQRETLKDLARELGFGEGEK